MERFQEDFAAQPGAAVETAEPASFRIETLLRKCGIDDTTAISIRQRMSDIHVRELVKKFNKYARENPAVVLGALCALAVGGTVVAERARRSRNAKTRSASTRSASTRRSKKASSKRTLIEPHRRRHSKSTVKSSQSDKRHR
jgi:hypothetical protein